MASDSPLQRNQRERHLAWVIATILITILATLAWIATDKPLTETAAPVQQEHHE